jgi:aminomethyltransferase
MCASTDGERFVSASSGEALKRTPLFPVHVKAGARMVPFGGWEMPVHYVGIIEEHRTVRRAVGLFDVSHMGEFEFRGPAALAFLQTVTTNDVTSLTVGQVQYSLMCAPDGGIVDDLTVHRIKPDEFLVTVNAANIDKDWAWLTRHLWGGIKAENVSDITALLAVQGPRAEALVDRLADADVAGIGYYRFVRGRIAGAESYISRTGYTGEDGFEIYCYAQEAEKVWDALLDEGRKDGILPIGLGARDTLRLEMKYVLYGNDIDQMTNPIEAGLGWVVKLGKGDFLGRDAIQKVSAEGPQRKLVGFEMVDRAVPRHGYRIVQDGREIGVVTSGSYAPTVDRFIGMGYVAAGRSTVGTEIQVEVRGAQHAARVVRTPFYPSRVKKS